MKPISLILFICLAIGCTTTKSTKTKTDELNGTWIPVKQEFGGKELSADVYHNQTLVLIDSNYTVTAESVDKGIVHYSDGKMDIYGKQGANAGKHFTAIYKYLEGQLTICYNLAGDSYPTGFETKSKPALFLSVFKKETTKN